jgi:exodeoxyribonuclease VII large subunit
MSHDWENALIELQTWTISELNTYIREMFDIDIRLQDVVIVGEISNFHRARSGHVYFTLKDELAQLKCVMWRSSADRLRYRPEDGDAVVAYGRVSVYEAGGNYQLYTDSLDPAGKGDLSLAFEQLKERLAAEGLFDAGYKKSIPSFPRKIGIVTSADAAALRDILNVLDRRWPLVSVLIAPTLVQGKEAPPQIVRALQWLDGRNDIDTIIIARGGGSIEDLWAFNEESVARAIFDAEHPVISGVGHETDFTIADFVADLRASTPSAAAELATPDRQELEAYTIGLKDLLARRIVTLIDGNKTRVKNLARALSHLSPRVRLDNNRQWLDLLQGRLDKAMDITFERNKARLAVAQTGLAAVGPLATLARGYAIVRKEGGPIIRSVEEVTSGERLNIQVGDGDFDATAT